MSNEPDEVNSGALATIIVILGLSTLAVALVVTSLVRDETARLTAVGDVAQDREYRQLKAGQDATLRGAPEWIDREKGIARIPIESAMQLVLESVRANPLEMSPGNVPEDEEEESEDTDDAPEDEATEDEGTEGDEDGEAEEAEAAPEPKDAAMPAPKKPAPAPKKPAPKPTTPAPKPAAPAPEPVAPAPGGPTP